MINISKLFLRTTSYLFVAASVINPALAMEREDDDTIFMPKRNEDTATKPNTSTHEEVNMTQMAVGYFDSGNEHYVAKEYLLALQPLSQALQLNVDGVFSLTGSKRADAYHSRGMSYNRLGDYSKAISDFDKCLSYKVNGQLVRKGNSAARTHHVRGACYFRLKQYQKALDDYTASLGITVDGKPAREGGKRARTLHQRARASAELGMDVEARADYEEALNLTVNGQFALVGKDRAMILHDRGVFLSKCGFYQDAIESFTAALDMRDSNGFLVRQGGYKIRSLKERARTYCRAGLYEEATQDANEVFGLRDAGLLSLKPSDVIILQGFIARAEEELALANDSFSVEMELNEQVS